MDVAVEHFIREWGGASNALRAAERNLEYWRAKNNRALTKRYEEVIAHLEGLVNVKKDIGTKRKPKKKS